MHCEIMPTHRACYFLQLSNIGQHLGSIVQHLGSIVQHLGSIVQHLGSIVQHLANYHQIFSALPMAIVFGQSDLPARQLGRVSY